MKTLSPKLRDDRPLDEDVEAVAVSIRDRSLVGAVEPVGGELR